MITRKLATLGLGLALALGTAGAHAAQPAAQPLAQSATPSVAATATPASPVEQAAKPMTGRTGTLKTSKLGTKIGTTKLRSGRSVAAPSRTASQTMGKVSHRRLHVSHAKVKVSHRTHVAHVAKKGSSKHA